MAHTSGLRVGLSVSSFQCFYLSASRRVCEGVIQTLPGLKPTRGAPSFLNIPVYYNSDVLSSMDSVKRKAQVRAWATRPGPQCAVHIGNGSP